MNNMLACPPTGETRFDLSQTFDCVQQVQSLYQAYVNAISGNKRILVRFNERWSEYSKANADALLTLYVTLYNQCPNAKTLGLPDLNPANMVRRGAPARGFMSYPRM